MSQTILFLFCFIVISVCGNDTVKQNATTSSNEHCRHMIKIYAEDCKAGKGEACYILAALYDNGNCINASPTMALQYYKKACACNIAKGCYEAGWMFKNGFGAEKNMTAAKYYFVQSCVLNDTGGCLECIMLNCPLPSEFKIDSF